MVPWSHGGLDSLSSPSRPDRPVELDCIEIQSHTLAIITQKNLVQFLNLIDRQVGQDYAPRALPVFCQTAHVVLLNLCHGFACVSNQAREWSATATDPKSVWQWVVFFPSPLHRAIYFAAYSTAKEKLNGVFEPDSTQVHMVSAALAGKRRAFNRCIHSDCRILKL